MSKTLLFRPLSSDISLGFNAASQPTIYATSEKGASFPPTADATWQQVRPCPVEGSKVRAIATSLRHPETAYVSYDHLELDGKSWIGVAKTSNSGADWQVSLERSRDRLRTTCMTPGSQNASDQVGARILWT